MAGERDVLSEAREALRDAINDGWHGMDDSWIDYQAVFAALAARGWRLVPSAPVLEPIYPRSFLAGAQWAAASLSSEPLPREALDVDRLARAIDAADPMDTDDDEVLREHREFAAEIAAAYAALAPEGSAGTVRPDRGPKSLLARQVAQGRRAAEGSAGTPRQFCGDCDGVGWVEGGPTIKTTCSRCGGDGWEPEGSARDGG